MLYILANEQCFTALCWTTYRGAVAGSRDALLVVTPLAAVGIGRTAGTVREPVASLIHRYCNEKGKQLHHVIMTLDVFLETITVKWTEEVFI